jgi:hypothetical protein
MCNFFSCIVLKDGQVIWDAGIDSHEELIKIAQVEDKTSDPAKLTFARVEIIPPDNNVFEDDVKKWTLRIDQSITPNWWSKDHEKACYQSLKKCLSVVIIKGQEIDEINNKHGLYIKDSTIQVIKNSIIKNMANSTVNVMWANSTVNVMWENSTVNVMWANSTVKAMRENSTVKEMRENSTVNEMWANSTVNVMWENSTVNVMWENSTVKEMWANSTVNEMRENSTVNVMWENSTVKGIYSDTSKFNITEGSNGLVILRYKSDIEIVHAKGKKIKISEYKK